jgi:hypothetical protein
LERSFRRWYKKKVDEVVELTPTEFVDPLYDEIIITPEPTPTPTEEPTPTPTEEPTPTPTNEPTPTPTPTEEPTSTPEPSSTPTPTPTSTQFFVNKIDIDIPPPKLPISGIKTFQRNVRNSRRRSF